MEVKKFICADFQPNMCPFKVEGYEEEIVEISADHLIYVHEHEDTPQLRDDIRASLE